MTKIHKLEVSSVEVADLLYGSAKFARVLKLLEPDTKTEMRAWVLLIMAICERANKG